MSHISDYGGHIYVAMGRNGLLKVGFAGNVLNRVRSLDDAFFQRGDRLDSLRASGVIGNPRVAERKLIGFCDQRFKRHRQRGREWFVGADFDAVLLFAASLAGDLRPINLIKPWQEGGRSWAKARAIQSQMIETTRYSGQPSQRVTSHSLPTPAKQEAS